MINKLAADYAGIELGIGESLIMKAIGETTGRSLAVIKADQKEIGDLGLVAVKSRANQPTMFKPKALTVRGVHEGLIKIATTSAMVLRDVRLMNQEAPLGCLMGHKSGKVDIAEDKGGPSEAKVHCKILGRKASPGFGREDGPSVTCTAMVCHEIEAKGSGKVPALSNWRKASRSSSKSTGAISLLLN